MAGGVGGGGIWPAPPRSALCLQTAMVVVGATSFRSFFGALVLGWPWVRAAVVLGRCHLDPHCVWRFGVGLSLGVDRGGIWPAPPRSALCLTTAVVLGRCHFDPLSRLRFPVTLVIGNSSTQRWCALFRFRLQAEILRLRAVWRGAEGSRGRRSAPERAALAAAAGEYAGAGQREAHRVQA